MKVRLLPYERFEITTSLPPEEVVRKLKENTELENQLEMSQGKKLFVRVADQLGLSQRNKLFVGIADYPHFRLNQRLYSYYPPPILYGDIKQEGNDCRIAIDIKPLDEFTIIPDGILLLIIGIFIFFFFYDLISSISSSNYTRLSDWIIFFFGFLIMIWGWGQFWFWHETKKLKRIFNGILGNGGELT